MRKTYSVMQSAKNVNQEDINYLLKIIQIDDGEYALDSLTFCTVFKNLTFDEFVIPSTFIHPNSQKTEQISIIGNSMNNALILYDKKKCTFDIKTLIIPEGITEVKPFCFMGLPANNVIWPSTCSKIMNSTFKMSKIEKIEGINNVSFIEPNAFQFCFSLTQFTWPDYCAIIPQGCFYACEKLKEVTNLKSVLEVGYMAFSASGIADINLPNDCHFIDSLAFSKCSNLKRITWPAKCHIIPENCFFDTEIQKADISACLYCDIKDISLKNAKIIASIYDPIY